MPEFISEAAAIGPWEMLLQIQMQRTSIAGVLALESMRNTRLRILNSLPESTLLIRAAQTISLPALYGFEDP